jgi:cell division protein FtsB
MASRPAAANTKPNGRVEAEDPDSRTDTTVTVAVAKVTELRLENRALQARINDYQDGAIVSWTYTVRLEEEKEKLETQVEKLEADFKTAVETLCRFKKRVRALGNESQGDLVWRPERLWTSGLEDGRGGFAIGRDEWVYGVGIPMCSLLACVSRRTRQYVCGDGRVSIR